MDRRLKWKTIKTSVDYEYKDHDYEYKDHAASFKTKGILIISQACQMKEMSFYSYLPDFLFLKE